MLSIMLGTGKAPQFLINTLFVIWLIYLDLHSIGLVESCLYVRDSIRYAHGAMGAAIQKHCMPEPFSFIRDQNGKKLTSVSLSLSSL